MTTAVLERPGRQLRDVTINVRATEAVRDIIDRAAAVLGKTRSEFILDSAQKYAEDVLLDQRLFVLDDKRYQDFLRILSEPPAPNDKLRTLLSNKAPWER